MRVYSLIEGDEWAPPDVVTFIMSGSDKTIRFKAYANMRKTERKILVYYKPTEYKRPRQVTV